MQDYIPGLVFDRGKTVCKMTLDLCERQMHEKLSVFFALAWSFWFRRNKYLHDQLLLSPKQVADGVVSMLKSYGQVQQKNRIQLMQHYKWQAPQSEWLKLNVDGAVFSKLGKTRVGVVLRDDHGRVLMARCKVETEMEGIEAIELMAIFRGLQL
ncbi:uncharacterized protein LOC121242461 [Juglans microcarpa x Juglans regia]|uniref:uncharacterized protein LOC121242461 n=1 Tax=Juglans microcarpa x Juglans regia TaxID=2249226 RepID=UPI001B7DC871|nr:uncharacterized protein LOC121242461 [Juglans microcarpa x Juglans regia]